MGRRKNRGEGRIGSPGQYLCSPCQKVSLRDRADAKRYARQLRQTQDSVLAIDAYRCPIDVTRWHVGHTRYRRRNGEGG